MTARPWTSSIAFREFRREHTSQSRLYWTHRLSVAATARACAATSDRRVLPEVLELTAQVKPSMFPVKAEDFAATAAEAENTLMLLLLVMACANVEEYLKLVCDYQALALGHHEQDTAASLTAVGRAIVAPIAKSSTLPEMLRYAGALFGLELPRERQVLDVAFKVRCAMAHSGGVATAKVVKEVPSLPLVAGETIRLDWAFLFAALKATDDVCTAIDRTLTPAARAFETRRVALELLRESRPTSLRAARKLVTARCHVRATIADMQAVLAELGWPVG